MSVVSATIKTNRKEKMYNDLMCVYCEGVFTDNVSVCPECDEYDGLMPLQKAVRYLNLDINNYL